MGVYIRLNVDPLGITPSAWEAAFDETLHLLSAWKPALIGLRQREISRIRVAEYTSSIVRREGEDLSWCVVGDRESLRTGETHRLHRRLARSCRGPSPAPETEGGALLQAPRDILVPLAESSGDGASTVSLLSNKTQGHPYHYAVLAAGMVIEDRLPRAAVVSGDIDRAQAEAARRMARPILGRDLALPVRVEATRLLARLGEHFSGEPLPAAFQDLFLGGDVDATETMLLTCPADAAAAVWKRDLCRSYVNTVGVLRLLISWLNAGRSLATACRLACLAPDGPRFEPEAFIDDVAATWVAVPPSARDTFAPFRRPEGSVPSVWSQLGEFFLEATGSGRHTSAHLEPAQVRSELVEVFGEARGRALCQLMTEKSAKIEAKLSKSAAPVRDLVARAAAEGDDDTELLVGIGDPALLGPRQRSYVETVAFAASRVLKALRESVKERIIVESAEKAKGVLAALSSDYGPTFTEETWDRILALDDVGELSFCCALLMLGSNELHIAQTRRALIENRTLLHHAMAIARDEQRMAELEAQLETATKT